MLRGIELDTVSQELFIDPTRLAEIIDLLDAWSTKQHCTKRQLQFPLLASNFIYQYVPPRENVPTPHVGCPLQSSPSGPSPSIESRLPQGPLVAKNFPPILEWP